MRPLLVFLVLTCLMHGRAEAQEEPPVFRADAYVVAIDYAPVTGAPMLGLTSSDFAVTIDKKIAVAVKVVDDPARPGFYRITFSPPESLRDGKKHRVDVTRTNRKPVRFQMTFSKPEHADASATR